MTERHCRPRNLGGFISLVQRLDATVPPQPSRRSKTLREATLHPRHHSIVELHQTSACDGRGCARKDRGRVYGESHKARIATHLLTERAVTHARVFWSGTLHTHRLSR